MLGSKLPLVATATPVAVMLEPAPVAKRPMPPTPVVVTVPTVEGGITVRVTSPPVSA